jgi:PAS domain S-box-containing protein
MLGLAVSFWTFQQIEESSRMRVQTAAALSQADDLKSALVDAETSVRGYLLTGDEAFLARYLAERGSFAGRLSELRKISSDSRVKPHVAALAPLIDEKLLNMSKAVGLNRAGDSAAAIALVRTGEGKRIMDVIRAEVASIEQIEQGALAQREAAFDANMRRLFGLIVVFSVFVLALALVFAYLIYRESRQRLRNLQHTQTEELLEVQERANEQLQVANDTLLVSERKLAVTLDCIGDAVIATDASGCVAILNPMAEELTGWTREDALGHPIDEVFHIINEETRQPTVSPVPATLSQGTIHGLANHTVLIARDGSERAIADSCAPIRDGDNRVVGAVLVFRDVTESNRLDRVMKEQYVELERTRGAAEQANRAKSEFLSSMSHELRSPLNAILGFAQLMRSDSPPPTTEQQASIDQILAAGWHLLKLIDEILDLTRIESGQVPLSLEPVPLAAVLLECRGMIEPAARERGIRLDFPTSEVGCFVRADKTRATQVLVNLLSNAVKYNSEGGTIEVRCAETAPGRVRVSVADTGAGLSPVQQEQLFQAFNRLGQEAGGVEGTGIGLVVAKQLVELMGGTIGVESTIGAGSVFWFELVSAEAPSLEEPAPVVVRADQRVAHGERQHTLLYVEDNPANLQLVEMIIERHPNLRLLTAVNGHSGIAVARESRPDAILMDINLPDISGLEALRLLRAYPGTAHIPVVAVSANAMPRDIKRGLDAGFFRYITKPIMVNEFMEALGVVLEFADTQAEAAESALLLLGDRSPDQ